MRERYRCTNRSYDSPRRNEVWLYVDRAADRSHTYKDHVQAGTRTCIIVSNNTGNHHSPNIEVVFTTTQKKANIPTHFITNATPVTSTVLCEAIDTVPKSSLVQCYGELPKEEVRMLNECLLISLGLKD